MNQEGPQWDAHVVGGQFDMFPQANRAYKSLYALDANLLDEWKAIDHTYITDFDEAAQDAVGGILVDTTTIDFTYADATPSITADVKKTLDSSYITDFTEAAQDAVGGALVDSSRIDFTYNDGANTITADLVAGSVDASFIANRTRSIFYGAADFEAATGAGDPALTQVATDASGVKVNAYVFPTAADKAIERWVDLPSDWVSGSITIEFFWAPSSVNTNTAVWICALTTYTAGDLVDKALTNNPSATVTPSGTAKAIQTSTVFSGTTPATRLFKLAPYRFTASASDTFTGDMWFFGARISYTADS